MQTHKPVVDSNQHVIDYQRYWHNIHYIFTQYEHSHYDSWFD